MNDDWSDAYEDVCRCDGKKCEWEFSFTGLLLLLLLWLLLGNGFSFRFNRDGGNICDPSEFDAGSYEWCRTWCDDNRRCWPVGLLEFSLGRFLLWGFTGFELIFHLKESKNKTRD